LIQPLFLIMILKTRLYAFAVVILLTPIGFYTKFFHGPHQNWVYSYAGDIFYPMFWFFVLIFIRPRMSAMKAAIIIFIFCTAIELSQLLSFPLLEKIRETFIGRTIIGVHFVLVDIIYYAVGCALGLYNLLHLFGFPVPPSEPERHN